MKRNRMDDLLGAEEPFATFHDAYLQKVAVDYSKKELTMGFDLSVGDPNGITEETRQRYRKGVLKALGLVLWALEAPQKVNLSSGPLWLTDDGLLEDAPTETAKKLSLTLRPELTAWYMYFSCMNCFGYLAAEKVVFEWKAA